MGREIQGNKPAWVGSKEGISNKVLFPWSPIQVQRHDQTVSVKPWGRSYDFRGLPFPEGIESAGRQMLAKPIRLAAQVDSTAVTWEQASHEILEETPASVRLSHSANAGPLVLSAYTVIEYDGIIRIDCKISSKRSVRLEKLTLEIPLQSEHVRYRYDFTGKYWSKSHDAGALPQGGFVAGFRPFIWLGDNERGLAWFCESDENFSLRDRNVVTEIGTTYDSQKRASPIMLRIHLVSAPIQLSPAGISKSGSRESLSYTFGLQATPVKPVEKDVWDHRITHMETTFYGIENGLRIAPKTLDKLAAAGVKTIAVHEHWTDIEAYVTTTHGKDLKELVKGCHERGIQILLYFGFLISDLAPEWAEFGEECVVMPRGGYEPYDYPPQPKQNAYRVCYQSVWQDRLAEGIAKVIDEYDVDGVYLDHTEYVGACSNRLHGCGYLRPDGTVGATLPLWAVRNMMKRIYTIVKERKPDGQVNVHNSTCMTIPTMGWATSYWEGEQFRDVAPGATATDVLPLDAFRTLNMGYQWGVPAEFMSYEADPNRTFFFLYDKAHAVTLLHDVPIRSWRIGPSLELNSMLWRLRDDFGCKQARWLPYWRNSEFVSVTPDGAYVSLHHHPKNGVLAVVSNLLRSDAVVDVRFQLDRLGQKAPVSVIDALTREPVKTEDNGRIQIPLESLGWKILWIRSDGENGA